MDRMVAIIIETVFTAIIVIFLFSYLLQVQNNGRTGIWDSLNTSEDMYIEHDDFPVMGKSCVEPVPNTEFVKVNMCYQLEEFLSYAKVIRLVSVKDENGVDVLAIGDIESLSEEEMPAAVLHHAQSGEILFTRSGVYRMTIQIRQKGERRRITEISLTVMALSEQV